MSRASMLNLSVFPRMEDLQEEESLEMVEMEAAEDGDEVTLTAPPDVTRPAAMRCVLGCVIFFGSSLGAALIFLYVLHQFSL